MKKLTLIISLIFVMSSAFAQSAMVQKAAKSVFSLTTFKADGTILATSHGVFSGASNECISSFTPFIGASSAVIMDAYGRKAQVESIIGANEMYDICRFKVDASVATLAIAEKPAKDKVFAISYSVKRPSAKALTIKSVEKFMEKYNYYVFNEEITDEYEGCPIVNDAGQMIGLVQRANTTYDIQSTDARFYSELASSGLSSRDEALKKTSIRIALPDSRDQARLMLMMIDAQTDSMNVIGCVNEYNSRYPNDVDGYSALSRYQVSRGNLSRATQAMQECIRTASDKAEAYGDYAKQIYNVAAYLPDSIPCEWTLDLAEQNIQKAIDINGASSYKHQLGLIRYAKGDYQQAFNIFDEISKADMGNSEVFYEMAQAKSQLGADNNEILSYLDKAIEKCPQPLTNVSAPYFYTRGVTLDAMGEYKKALQDYNTYDTLMYFRGPAEFYYTRHKCEIKVRQYQQALNDIAHAAVLQPGEATYLAEMASLQLRVGQYENAVRTCNLCLNITDEYSDIFIIAGVALMKLEHKEEAKAAFERAKELGDERADEYLQKL